jgi:uncharacterized C2H2 Zn-finger protein
MAIVDDARKIADLVKEGGNVELYRKMVELEAEIVHLTTVCRDQGAALRRLRLREELIATLRFDVSFYTSRDGLELYCPRCVESDGAVVHVLPTPGVRKGHRVWHCPQCNVRYTDMRGGGAPEQPQPKENLVVRELAPYRDPRPV